MRKKKMGSSTSGAYNDCARFRDLHRNFSTSANVARLANPFRARPCRACSGPRRCGVHTKEEQ